MRTKLCLEKPEGKTPLRPRCRWEDNIKTDFREIWLEGVDWIHLAYDMGHWRVLVKTALNLRLP
jgi:hypothetical protein